MSGEVTPETVLEFWLGAPGDPPLVRSSSWYKKDAAFDKEIKDRFEATLNAAKRGELDDWKKTPRGRLAFVILNDQFSRNMFRGTSDMFAQDALARDTALDAIAQGDEGQLKHVERSFLYMPLMHAEDVDLQRKCVAAFGRLVDSSPPELKSFLESGLHYAKLHADIVERFGRFPHRNAILNRPTTREEETFLKTNPGF